jgi:hypothetical protein
VRFSRRETAAPGERKAFVGLRVARDIDSPPAPAAEPAKAGAVPAKGAPAKDAKSAHPEPAKAPHGK